MFNAIHGRQFLCSHVQGGGLCSIGNQVNNFHWLSTLTTRLFDIKWTDSLSLLPWRNQNLIEVVSNSLALVKTDSVNSKHWLKIYIVCMWQLWPWLRKWKKASVDKIQECGSASLVILSLPNLGHQTSVQSNKILGPWSQIGRVLWTTRTLALVTYAVDLLHVVLYCLVLRLFDKIGHTGMASPLHGTQSLYLSSSRGWCHVGPQHKWHFQLNRRGKTSLLHGSDHRLHQWLG